LYRIDEIPEWMTDNKYILGSYRAGYTLKMCLRSIFSWHNETMNVWTHLLGLIFFAGFGASLFVRVLEPVFSHFLAFACEPELKWMYLSMICVLGSVGLIGPFYGFWTTPEFHMWKMLVYTCMVGSGVFPIIHVNFIMPASSSAPFAIGLALEIFLYFSGMIIYILKAPERWFPGRFDCWLHSHQIWHVFVLMAALVHFFTIAGMYLHWEGMVHHC
jgi:adiponectin receptor